MFARATLGRVAARSRLQPAPAAALIHTGPVPRGLLGKIQRVLKESRPAAPAQEDTPETAGNQQQPHDLRSSDLQQATTAAKTDHGSVPAAKKRQHPRGGAGDTQPPQIRLRDAHRPADPMVAMPKVFGEVEQPADAEIGKFAIIGAANAGKSTLINSLTGARVSIVSSRPQTTRTRIMASTTENNKQLLFLDTPGVVSRQALRRVSRSVVTSPWLTLAEADYLIILLDAYKLTEKTDEVEKYLFAQLKENVKTPAILVINKIDMVSDNEKLGLKVKEYMAKYENIAAGPIFISALGHTNVEELRDILLASTKPGKWEMPADVKCDMSDLMRVEELIRAEWFAQLEGHLPYVVRQRNVGWEEVPIPARRPRVPSSAETKATDGPENAPDAPDAQRTALVISQELVVSSSGEAKILTGAKGSVIRDIGRAANINISKALGRPVRLHLQVIVEEDTRRRK